MTPDQKRGRQITLAIVVIILVANLPVLMAALFAQAGLVAVAVKLALVLAVAGSLFMGYRQARIWVALLFGLQAIDVVIGFANSNHAHPSVGASCGAALQLIIALVLWQVPSVEAYFNRQPSVAGTGEVLNGKPGV